MTTLNILFQVYAGIYSLQKHFNITHHDLHLGNILFLKSKPGSYTKYTIDNIDYYLPNLGFTVTLWDFGFSMMPGILVRDDDFYRGYIKNMDINNPQWMNFPRLTTDAQRITESIIRRTGGDSILHGYASLVHTSQLFNLFSVYNKIEQFTDEYNMDKKEAKR